MVVKSTFQENTTYTLVSVKPHRAQNWDNITPRAIEQLGFFVWSPTWTNVAEQVKFESRHKEMHKNHID